MAALFETAPQAPVPVVVDLRALRAADLEPLLEEETRTWEETLDWDFRKSADLVRRFVDLRALHGRATLEDGAVTGYGYFVVEDHKGLIGDLYVRRAFRTAEREHHLLAAVLEALMDTPYVSRIECQLMMIDPPPGWEVPGARFLGTYRRNFMLAGLESADLRPGRLRYRVFVEKWLDQYQEPAAQLIASAYAGHVDSHINDQYRSVAGARRFLFNIVQYPGCGCFFRPASYAAIDLEGRICGLCLASLVAPEVGHITQICVANWVRGAGVGYELLRESLLTLRDAGCRKVSLTVTSSNRDAIQLYERVGFATRRQFSAYVWEGF